MRGEMRSHSRLADLAEQQYGVVSYRQMRELGFSKGHVYRAHEADRLRRVYRGVYAVGHSELPPHGRCRAALLAFNDEAVLSHHSAGWLWGLLPSWREEIDVTLAGKGRRQGIRIHRARVPGATQLKQALALYRKPIFDRARSELLFLDAIEKEGERLPVLNLWVGKWEIDAYWEAERFAVEVDGWETHGSREAFENDLLRQEEMKLAGIDCIRISARRIEAEPQRVAKRIRTLLAQRRTTLQRTTS